MASAEPCQVGLPRSTPPNTCDPEFVPHTPTSCSTLVPATQQPCAPVLSVSRAGSNQQREGSLTTYTASRYETMARDAGGDSDRRYGEWLSRYWM